jgi:hypothetical protein
MTLSLQPFSVSCDPSIDRSKHVLDQALGVGRRGLRYGPP